MAAPSPPAGGEPPPAQTELAACVSSPIEFWFDLGEMSATPARGVKLDPIADLLAQVLRAGLTEAQQQQLRN